MSDVVFVVIEIKTRAFIAVYRDYGDIPTRYTERSLYPSDNRYEVLEEKLR